ncbi:hypothetical protein [Sorangium sp. So ce1182]|uniref:hypothetical protein n=1 Tax=Sorangium sp. So ce1182 TaxID=3133334 RepID=UPI003F614CE2
MATKTFDFQFTTLDPSSGQQLTNTLFVGDAPMDTHGLDVEATAATGIGISLKVVPNKQVSDSNYHFKLTFDPDELAHPEAIVLDAAHSDEWGMLYVSEKPDAASAEEGRAPGDVDIYFLYRGTIGLDVTAETPLHLSLKKVSASSSRGTRATIVSFTWNSAAASVGEFVVVAGGPGGDYTLTESVHLKLLAQAAPTLMAGFVSSDIILNDGDTENGLVLRIVNTGLLPIPLSPEGSPNPSRFTLRFEASEQTADLWALGTASLVGQILIPAKEQDGSWVSDPNWSGKDTWTVAHTAGAATWTLTPKAGKTALAPGEALEVPIGKVVTGHATGRTPLRIGYSGLTGFSDGELVAFIQKYPLIFAGQRVGAGTGAPSHKLTVHTSTREHGFGHTDGTVTLQSWVDAAGGSLGTESSHPLRFFTGGEGPQVTLTTEGKLGIGTESPSEKLTVKSTASLNDVAYGIAHTNVTLLGKTTTLSTRLSGDHAEFGTRTPHDLGFFTDGSDAQMTLTKEGNLGIGTKDPSDKLTIRTEDGKQGLVHTSGSITVSTYVGQNRAGVGTLTSHPITFFTNSGAPEMVLTPEGNVGIGTEDPGEKLTVKTDDGKVGISHMTESITLSTYIGHGRAALGTKTKHPLAFYTNAGGPQMLLAIDGNVGIGTETPGAKLEVNGSLNVRGELKINGSKPIEYRTYEGSSSTAYVVTTTYKSDEWIAVVAGFDVKGNGDGDDIDWLYVKAAPEGGVWTIRADTSEGDSGGFRVNVIFIRRELVS